jgi:hypothetical protein
MEKNIRKLKASEIECRVGTINEKGCSLLLYKDARCDMRILDETFGAMNWKRSHEIIDGNLYCTVSVLSDVGEWVSKQDVGVESFTEKEKGQASDSFKRACVNWGIGRELYTSPFIWVNHADKEAYQKNGKSQTYQSYHVTEIGYNAEGEINALAIADSKGNERYRYGRKQTTTPAPQPQPAPVPQMSAEEKAKRDKAVIDYLYANPKVEKWCLEKAGVNDMLELDLDKVYNFLKSNNKI